MYKPYNQENPLANNVWKIVNVPGEKQKQDNKSEKKEKNNPNVCLTIL